MIDIHVFICFLTFIAQYFVVILVLFELNMSYFLLQIEKKRKYQNLLFLAILVQVRLYLWKSRTKKEKLRNDVMKFYLRNHRKIRKPWLNSGEDKKKEVRRKFRTLGRFFLEIGSLTYPERFAWNIKLERHYRKSCFLQS